MTNVETLPKPPGPNAPSNECTLLELNRNMLSALFCDNRLHAVWLLNGTPARLTCAPLPVLTPPNAL